MKEIPRWFCFARYRRSILLDAIGWYEQISVRQVCFSQVSDMNQPDRILPEWDSPVQQALASLRTNPVCDLTASPFNHAAFSFIRDPHSSPPAGVRSMTLRDLYRIDRSIRGTLTQSQIDEAQKMASDRSVKGIFRFSRQDPEWMTATVEEKYFGLGYIPIMIDLNLPNSALKEHFKKHLQRLRLSPRGNPDEARKKSPDFAEWTSFGLLACIDLLLWAEQEGVRISNRLIADALGSDENSDEVDEERVRQTIRPLGIELLNPFLDSVTNKRLWDLALAAQSTRKTRRGTGPKKPV